MSPAQVERTLTRLAYEIVERNRGADNLLVFGIEAAGARLARSLARRLSEMEGRTVESHDLDVTAFRDDTDEDPAAVDQMQRGSLARCFTASNASGVPAGPVQSVNS